MCERPLKKVRPEGFEPPTLGSEAPTVRISYLFTSCEVSQLSSILSMACAASDFAETVKVRSAETPEKGHFVRIRKRPF